MTPDTEIKSDRPKNTIFCHACNAYTVWERVRGGREKCRGCGDVFPCRHECKHVDCADARAEKKNR